MKFPAFLTRSLLLLLSGAMALPATAAPAPYAPPASPRASYNFNPGWKFIREDVAGAEAIAFDDNAWTSISTPHTWNDVDSYRKFMSHGSGDVSGIYMGIGWYRKHFKLPAMAQGQKVFLEFEGIKQAGRFWLNGQYLGKFENGVSACGLDLTAFVKFGNEDNVIAVKVDNSNNYVEEDTRVGFQWVGRAFNPNYGGLNRNVTLHVMGKIYQTLPLYENLQTTGVYVYALNHNLANKTADLTVESQVRNDSGQQAVVTVSAVVVDAEGQVRATLKGEPVDMVNGEVDTIAVTGQLTNAHWWDVNDPYLYKVYSVVTVNDKVVDVCQTTTGFRKTDFRGGVGTGGVFLNDKFTWLTGYAQRSVNDWAGFGQAYPNWMHDFNAALVRASNANYIRWMHIAPQAADVAACDKFGIVQMCPAGDKEADVQGRQWEQRMELMRATIISYRNSPSILFWEAGNQVINATHMAQMVEVRKQWDPNGGRIMGVRHGDNSALAATVTPVAEFYGVMVGQDPRTDSLETSALIFRGYSAERRDRAPLIETEDFRDEAPRGVWDDFSPPSFGFKKGPQDTYSWNSETFALAASARYNDYVKNRIDSQDPTHSKWSGYASIYWSDSNADGRQQSSEVVRVSGKVDSVRLPKQAFYLSRVMQNTQPDVHIIGHWTYPADTKKTIYVAASNCDSVELFVNGQSKGVVKTAYVFPDDAVSPNATTGGRGDTGFIYAFPDITFAPGALKAVALKNGKPVATDDVKTAGAPAAILLTVHTGPAGLQADGSDAAFVDVAVVDAQGNICPTDEARVDFAVDGPALWRGGINSAIQNSTNNLYLNTECGINRVHLRSTQTAGTITLKATRDGLPPATVQIKSNPVVITNGLTAQFPQSFPGLATPVPNLVPVSASL